MVSTEVLTQLDGRLDRIDGQLDRIDRMVSRIHRDVERVKLHTGLVLEPTRALALLASGQRIYVDPRDGGPGINLLSDGKYEEAELTVFKRHLRPGAVVLDIGANYGIYSISAAPYVRPGGKVIGFEPNPHVWELFKGSVYVNDLGDVVEAHRLGVHNSNGTLKFLIDESGPAGARVVEPDAEPGPGASVIDIPVIRLDDYLPPDLVADVVKIDVEGHEEGVLRGMRNLIERSPHIVILMELFYLFFPDDETYRNFIHFITHDLGLTISRIGANAALIPADADSLRGTTGNVLLSKQAPQSRPDLTIVPEHLHFGPHARMAESQLSWTRSEAGDPNAIIAHGPYLYLPKGYYRLTVDADFDGDFTCSLLENYGDVIASYRVPAGRRFEVDVPVTFDAPSFEIAFWPADANSAEMTFRKAELWKIG